MLNQAPDNALEDIPDRLKDEAERARRIGMLTLPHMKPLTDFLNSVASRQGADYQMPHFDPCDGGINAKALLLLEAPGPKAVGSGFISRDNPDPTARNLWHLMRDVEIPRSDTLIWNIVPWYVGERGHIRPVTPEDIRQATPFLAELLQLLPCLQLIVLVGKKAQSAGAHLCSLTPVPIKHTHHMSAQVFNISPDKKREVEEAFADIALSLRDNKETKPCPNH